MLLTRFTLLLCCVTLTEVAAQHDMVARSNIESMGIIGESEVGNKVNVTMQNLRMYSRKKESRTSGTNAMVKQRCNERIRMLLGNGQRSSLMFRREVLLCQYQEVHVELRKSEKEYEKALRENTVKNKIITNPYRKAYGNKTVNPHNFQFIMQPEPCDESHTLLISVHSATQNFKKRTAIRSTWGNHRIFKEFLPKGNSIKLIFVLGLPQNVSNQTAINYEHEMNRDIVQADFIDHYYNNTYKAIYNMKWISGYGGCPKVKLVIKADDDILFNLRKFPSFFKNFTHQLGNNFDSEALVLAGNQFGGGPSRDPKDKWYLPYHVYKYDTFPKWFQGMVYILTPHLARKIYELSFTTPYIFTDDVYVGIVADRVEKLSRYNIGWYYSSAYHATLHQKLVNWRFDPLVFYHNSLVRDMYSLWFFYCAYKLCD